VIVATRSRKDARKESRATTVVNMNDYGAQELSGMDSGPVLGDADEALPRARGLRGLPSRRTSARRGRPPARVGIELVIATISGERRRVKRPERSMRSKRRSARPRRPGPGREPSVAPKCDRQNAGADVPSSRRGLRAIVESALLERGYGV